MSRVNNNRKTISYYSDVFDFGKYKGLSVDQVMNQDPGYLIWAQENCQSVKLRQDILDEAEQLAEQNKNDYNHFDNQP